MVGLIVHLTTALPVKKRKEVRDKVRRRAADIAERISETLGADVQVFLGGTLEHLTPTGHSDDDLIGAYVVVSNLASKVSILNQTSIKNSMKAIKKWLDVILPDGFVAEV